MDRRMHAEMRRDPRFLDLYRGESRRMHSPPAPEPEPKPQPQDKPHPERKTKTSPSPMQDQAVILPLLLLLMHEGADHYLLLALLYILM